MSTEPVHHRFRPAPPGPLVGHPWLEGVEWVSHSLGLNELPALRGIEHDSRRVEPGYIFVALVGQSTDGHRWLEQAQARGAGLLVVQAESARAPRDWVAALDRPWLAVVDTRRALSILAANAAGRPSEHLDVVGITGTNGKTTTAFAVESMLRAAGRVPALLGTVEQRWPGVRRQSAFTTPDALALQADLAAIREAGADCLAMEVSSHALDQRRVEDVAFSVAAFTNLGWDHLDYHGSREAYFHAKARLFTELLPHSPRSVGAAICVDSAEGRALAERCPAPVLRCTVGESPADLSLAEPSYSPSGTRGVLKYRGQSAPLASPLIGAHNAQNLVVAAGCGVLLGLDLPTVASGLASLAGVPGRLQRVAGAERFGFDVLIDYAHTPDALEAALLGAAPGGAGRLIVVFGCGGDRDPSKRPVMGQVAGTRAHMVVVTNDNPRSELPSLIAEAAAEGVRNAGLERASHIEGHSAALRGGQFAVQLDRRAAIGLAIRSAQPGDVVVVAGKGHETGQEAMGVKAPFDDLLVAAECLAALEVH